MTEQRYVTARGFDHDACKAEPEPRDRCWVPDCERRGLFHDWAGWVWCWRHVRMYGMRPLRKGSFRV